MPNALLNEYRQRFPDDQRSDDEINFDFSRELAPDVISKYPDLERDIHQITMDIRRANAPGLPTELGRSVLSGIDTTQAKLYDTAALAGDIFGIGPLQRFGQEGYRLNLQEAQENAPTISNVRDVGGVEDAARYALGLVGSQAPQIGLTLAGGAAGALAGGPVGMAIGAGLTGFTQMQPYGELSNTPGIDPDSVVPTSLAVGTVGAILEELVPLSVLGKLFRGAPAAVGRSYLQRVGMAVGKDAIIEGGTEIAQELATIAGEAYANRANPDYTLTREDVENRLINNGFGGVLLGGLAGGAGELGARRIQPPPGVGEPSLAVPGVVPNVSIEAPGFSFQGQNIPEDIARAMQQKYAPTSGQTVDVAPAAPVAPLAVTPPDVALQQAQAAALAAGIPAPLQPELSPEQAILAGTRGPAPYFPPGEPPITVPRPLPIPVMPPVSPVGPAPYVPPGEPPITIPRPPTQTTEGETYAPKVREIESGQSLQLSQAESGGIQQPEAANRDRTQEGGPIQETLPLVSTTIVPKPMALTEIDFENAGFQRTKRGRTETEVAVEPYLELTPQPYSTELGKQITSDKGTYEKPSITRRVTFFENRETGEVVGLPSWSTFRNEKPVYRVGPAVEGESGTTLKSSMDGPWDVLASVRRGEPVEGTKTQWRYQSAEAFQESLGQPAKTELRRRIGEAQSNYDALMAKSQHQAFDDEGNVIELAGDFVPGGEDVGAEFADLLTEHLPVQRGEFARDLTPDNVREAIVKIRPSASAGVNGMIVNQLIDVIKTLPAEEREKFGAMNTEDQKQYLLSGLAKRIHEQINRTPQVDEIAKLYSNVQTPSGGNLGPQRPSAATGAGAGQYFQPSNTAAHGRAPNGEVARRFAQVAQRLGELGVTLKTLKGLREWGNYRNNERLITIVMHDVENPTVDNLRALLHEASHDLFARFDPKYQAIIRTAIDAHMDDQLGIDRNSDVRFREGTIPPGQVSEERLAQFLAQLGLDEAPAKGIAADIVRLVKELYFRAAMALQRAFGRQPSPDLARRWVENRFSAYLGGGSLSNFLIPPFVNQRAAEDAELYSLRAEGMGERHTPIVIPETEIASLNELMEKEKGIILPILKRIGSPGTSDDERLAWFRSTFGLPNAQVLKDAILQRAIDPTTGNVLPVNGNKRITDFSADQNRAIASRAYAILAQQMYSKVHDRTETLRVRSEELEKHHKERADDLKQKIQDYTNVEGLTKLVTREIQRQVRRLFEDISGESIKLGVISQELADLDQIPDVIKVYEPVLKKLFGKGRLEHQGEKITGYLERMASDPNIDLSAGIRAIREQLKQAQSAGEAKDTSYSPLIQNTQESRALLAATIAYAKTHEPLIMAVALRKVTDVKLRTKINEHLQALRVEGEDFVRQMPTIASMSKLETRLFDAMRQDKKEVKAISNRAKEAKEEYLAGQSTVESLRKNMQQAHGPNQVHASQTFGDGMEVWAPNRNDATGLGEGLDLETVKLDSSTGQPTSREQIIKWTDKQFDFLEDRRATGKLDGTYYNVLAQYRELIGHGLIGNGLRPSDHLLLGLKMSDVGTQMKSFGLQSSRAITQMLTNYVGTFKSVEHDGTRKSIRIQRAVSKAAKALGVPQEFYQINLANHAIAFMENQRDILEGVKGENAQFNEAFDLLKQRLSRDDEKAALLKGKWDKFIPLLREHLLAAWDASKWGRERVSAGDIGVIDPQLKVEGKERGTFVPGQRAPIQIGLLTIPQRLSAIMHDTFGKMAHMSNGLSWADFNPNQAENYNTLGPDEVRNYAQRFFTDPDGSIQGNFLKAIATRDTDSPFNAPVHPDGVTQPEANPALATEAYKQSGGDVVTFLEKMYDLHGGKTDRGQYVQEGLQKFNEIFNEMRTAMGNFDANGMRMPENFRTMINGFMINARQKKMFPPSWLEYETFGSKQMHRIHQKIAAETAFGPGNSRLEAAFDTLTNELRAADNKLTNAEARAKQTLPTLDKKVIDAFLEKEVGGEEELARLRRFRELSPLVGRAQRGLIEFFRTKNDTIKSVRVIQDIINALATGAVEQPTSTLNQSAEIFSPILREPSPANVRYVLRNLKEIAAIGGEGFFNALGLSLLKGDRMRQLYRESGLGDSASARTLADGIFGLEEPDITERGVAGKISRGIRRVGQVLGTSINREGTPQPIAAIRPIAPFGTFNNMIHASQTINLWKQADAFVSMGVKSLARLNPDMSLEQIADTIEVPKLERSNFLRFWKNALYDHGLDFYILSKEAARNEKVGRDRLSEQTRMRLLAMGIKTFISESNIMTMPLGAFNNSAIKAMSPLLNWSFRRGQQLTSLRLDPEGKASWAAAARGLTGLMLLGAGGLAVSALVDLYNEDVLKKKRNLRRLTTDAGARNLAQAILEHSARVGTLGPFGDLANSATNVLTGAGDNRGLSFDGRIVFASSMTSLLRTISAFVNEGFSTDYATVARPAIQAAGGNGALQYMQLINQISGDLFKREAEAVRRTSINNWLRVIGRETGMEVRPMDGGIGTPTPITPWVTRMQLAAYGNDPADFNRAYQGALREAREERKPDPVDYVQHSFTARHPLRSIFLSPPSDMDYRRMLMALPEDGRTDVRNAVNSFNRFAAMIGARPYEGRTPKQPTRTAVDLAEARDRALFR